MAFVYQVVCEGEVLALCDSPEEALTYLTNHLGKGEVIHVYDDEHDKGELWEYYCHTDNDELVEVYKVEAGELG